LQATKTKSERAQNIKGVFEVNRPDWIAEKNVLLADDLFITGATANEVAKKLKMSMAGKIYIYILGRVIVVKGLGS
jgi:competence protein ComFC